MQINDSVLQNGERVLFALREVYQAHGYAMYRMSKFEEYDLYADNKDFLVSDNVITFTDPNGRLLALKPDVTLSIIKNSSDLPDQTQKVYYNENVYRVSKGGGAFREIMQAGVECFGRVGAAEICEVLALAAESLRLLSDTAILSVSDLDILAYAVDGVSPSPDLRRALYKAIGEKNLHEIDALCADVGDRRAVERLKILSSIHGTVGEALPQIAAAIDDPAVYADFAAVMRAVGETPFAELFRVDFSVTGDTNYYNGIVFKGFLRGLPAEVLSGGQYDRLMRKFGRRSSAIGFAVYTDAIERPTAEERESADLINIALPKGRLGEKVYAMFAAAGFECPSILEPNRKLVFENPEKGVRFFWVKPSDVAIYVERGAADLGVVGKDILLEYAPEIYELLDMKLGRCRMAVAAPKGYRDNAVRTLRVATKFSDIARDFYRKRGRDIDIIHLNGSIELAPILGLSDVIVDIVETGTTLRENDLEVIDAIMPISARLIANRAAFKFRSKAIEAIADGLAAVIDR